MELQTPPRIRIVDDMPDIRLMMAQYLAHHGYQTATANDGRDALDQIGLMWPDLMLVDLWMPRLNGIETLEAIRLLPQGATLPVIAFTAHAMAAEREEALSCGFNSVITKPVELPLLRQTIQTLLHQNSLIP
jgi:CheY-like chemotaxis protein